MRAPRSIMVCTVSCQSSGVFRDAVRFESLWQSWQNSVAIAFPSPSGNSADLGGCAAAAPGEPDEGAAADGDPAAGAALCGPKFLTRYAIRVSTLSCGMRAPRSIMVCTVSCQSSGVLRDAIRFESLWQSWQYSVAIAFPSPSANSTPGFGCVGEAGGVVAGPVCCAAG